MSVESNKQAILKYFDAINRQDTQGILDMTTEDFVFKSMMVEPDWLRGTMERDKFAEAPASMSAHMTSPMKLTIGDIIGEGDKMAVEATSFGKMKSGKTYQNQYHFAIWLRNGKLTEVREYSCSAHAANVFGEGFANSAFSETAASK